MKVLLGSGLSISGQEEGGVVRVRYYQSLILPPST